MKKRLLSLLLVLGILTGLLSIGAVAVDYTFEDDTGTGTWSWASAYIYDCYDAGIINGYEDGTYLPDSSLTRAEAAKIIAVTFGLESDAAESTFSDVADSHWALEYIEACVDAGIINGYEDGTFLPGNNVTRAEMAKMIAAALELTTDATESSFGDTASHWAMAYIEACVGAGIVNGYEDGTFLPSSSISRAEAAAIISRTLDYIESEKDADQLYAEFKAKDANDFGDQIVINLDEDETTNFAVLVEGSVAAEAAENENILTFSDEETGTYLIDKAGEEILSLEAGDILYYVYGDGSEDYVLVKVETVIVSDDTVVVIADDSAELSDFFDYVDVDMEVEITEEYFTPTESDGVTFDGVEYTTDSEMVSSAVLSSPLYVGTAAGTGADTTLLLEPLIDSELEATFCFTVEYTFENGGTLSGTLKEKFTGSILIQYDAVLFGKDYCKLSLTLGSLSTVGLMYSASASTSSDDSSFGKIPLGTISIPVGTTGVFLTGDVNFVAELKAKGSIAVVWTMSAEVGMEYETGEDFDLLSEGDAEASLTASVELSFFAGISTELSATFLKAVELSVDAQTGLQIEGKSDAVGATTDNTEKHLCYLCIDGDVSLMAEASGKVKLIGKSLAESAKAELSYELFDFYISKLTPSASMEFGTGTCPYKEYRVTVTAQDSEGNLIDGASVYYEGDLQDEVTDENGEIILWCEDGTHTVSILKDGYSAASMTFAVDGGATDITVTLLENTGILEVTVTDADSNEEISGADVTISRDSSVLYELTTGSDGVVRVSLSAGTYTVTITADGYEEHNSTVSIEADLTTSESVQLKSTADDSDIPEDAVEYNGHYYYVYTVSTTWARAEEYCESLGGHLVTITSAGEQALIESLLEDQPDTDYYIGLRESLDNYATWVTGEAVTYTNWGNDQPDDLGGNQTVAVIANGDRSGNGYSFVKYSWDDNSDGGWYFICEWD